MRIFIYAIKKKDMEAEKTNGIIINVENIVITDNVTITKRTGVASFCNQFQNAYISHTNTWKRRNWETQALG